MLWLVGSLGNLFQWDTGRRRRRPWVPKELDLKAPAILADLAVGWLVWSMVRELGGRDRLALIAAFVAVMNPVTWFDSVLWGQVDSFGVVFLLLGLRELWRDHPGAGRDLHGHRRPDQAAAGHPHPDRGRGHDPPGAVADRTTRRRESSRRRRRRRAAACSPATGRGSATRAGRSAS